MPFVPAPNIAMVEIRATSDSQKIENRIMVDFLASPSESDLIGLTDLVYTWCDDEYTHQLPDTLSINSVVVTDLSSDSAPQITSTGPALPGLVGGGSLPLNATLCYKLQTNSRGRSARGRFFVLSLPATQVSQNTVGATYAGNMQTALFNLLTAISAAGWLWTIVSYRHDNAPRPGGPVYFPVTDVVLTDRTVDSMRRRLPGRGT